MSCGGLGLHWPNSHLWLSRSFCQMRQKDHLGCVLARASLVAWILILFGGAIFDFVFSLYLEDHICQGEDSGNK